MTDLGALRRGTTSSGNGINNKGEITGSSSYNRSGAMHAFLYRAGKMKDLGTLGGTNSEGMSINASREVTGDSNIAGSLEVHAFLYSKGVMHDIGAGYGRSIHKYGQIVGGRQSGAFLYDNGTMTDLASLISPSDPLQPYAEFIDATGISDTGLIVANGTDSRTGEQHGYLLTPIQLP